MMGGPGSGKRGGRAGDYFRPASAPTLYQSQIQEMVRAEKPLEYQLVDLLSDAELPEEVSEAVRLLLPFIGKCRRLDAEAAKSGELAAMQHDLERVMARENLYLNALMEITGLREPEAVKIATRALYGERAPNKRLPRPPASAIEARRAETPKSDSVADESAPGRPNQGGQL